MELNLFRILRFWKSFNNGIAKKSQNCRLGILDQQGIVTPCHLTHIPKKAAFTLAEVLITLGIIGIVAALTMPTIIQHQQKKTVALRLKKFYNIMNQAVLMSEQENGPSENWPMSFNDYTNQENESNLFYNVYLAKYLKNVSKTRTSSASSTLKVYLTDGSAFKVGTGSCADFKYFIKSGDIDKKIATLTEGKDYFSFRICPQNNTYGGGKTGFQTAVKGGIDQRTNRDNLLEKCKNPDEDDNTCSALIQYDDWEIKDDYPW